MARVFPGQDFQDVYDARKIYTTNIQGDDYKVRRSANDSNLDPRTNSQYQKKIVDAFSLASRIWSNKRECWKDHFRRGHKLFRYNEYEVDKVSKDLTGYQLAMNILINSLKTDSGQFYDPQCFCITPTDIFGEPLNTYSILDILQHSKLDYAYKEKKLTFDVLQPEPDQYNRFRSAVDPNVKTLEKCLLSSVGCVTRENTSGTDERDITLIKNIVQWPNFTFKTVEGALYDPGGIWNYEFFTYYKIPTEQLPVTDGSMRGYQITLGYPYCGDSLCMLGNLQLTLYTQYETITGFIQDTPNPPFFDIYYGDTLLGRFGNGGGGFRTTPLDLSNNYLNGSPNAMRFDVNLYPVIPGYQINMYPPGKLTECRLLSTEPQGGETNFCQWDRIYQYWDCGTQIEFHHGQPTVIAKFNPWCISGCDPGDPFCEYPNCAIYDIYGSNDMQNWTRVSGANQVFPFSSSGSPICIGDNQYHFPTNASFRYFMTDVSSSHFPYHVHYSGTLIGDRSCWPYAINDHCLGPAPGQRGLFFLEKLKPFEIKPVACRCPEYPCPPYFPESGPNPCTLSDIRRCPDDPSKAIIGDTCVECVGASPRGLVYDYLR